MENMRGGGAQAWPHSPVTRFRTKKGAQQTTKVEKTTPSTRLAFSSVTVEEVGGRGAKGRAAKIDLLLTGGKGAGPPPQSLLGLDV